MGSHTVRTFSLSFLVIDEVTFLFNHLITTSCFLIKLYPERILLHSAELKNVPDSSSSKKRALAFYEGPHSIQPARLIRRVSSGASVYPPSLIVWENAVDGHGNSSGSSSVGKGQVRQGSGLGSGVRHHASPRGCTNTMCGVPKGPHPEVHATAGNGSTDLNGSKDITGTTPCKIHSNFSPNTTNKTCHGNKDEEEFLWKKNKLKQNLNGNGNGHENGNGVSNEGIIEERMRNGDEDNESDSSLLFTSNCVQHVTTILVDEGDMNPLKVRPVTVLIVMNFVEVSSVS